MTFRAVKVKLMLQDELNFILSNRIPRRLATQWVGWFSRIENPLICKGSLWVWGLFTKLDFTEAAQPRYRSMHDCFTRRLQPGARPSDPDPQILVSPCDAILGASGPVRGLELLQVKGMPYSLPDLLGDDQAAAALRDGCYATLRLTSAMYHRFHAPHDCRVHSVTHIFGDVWNVNQPTLKRVARLFCKNERAVIETTLLAGEHRVTLVAVAAVLVAGIRLTFLDMPLQDRALPRQAYACDETLPKGAEMGWFEHGSTIIVFAPAGFTLCDGLREGERLRAGQPLMRVPAVQGLPNPSA